jgi:large subunit ribosomal protein L3
MGGERSTSQNLRVVSVDPERQMLLVNGSVPGTKDGYVIVQTAKKKD